MKSIVVLSCLIMLFSGVSGCKTVVTERPAEATVTVVRPPQPGPAYIWVDGEWYSRGGKYYRSQGRWVIAKRGRAWSSGHWQKGNHGWYWVPGHWR
ncbi:MAG TPA: hypothetical protein PLP23_05575 [Panacibacter sp.]|nr:hypothetical protein [Panacibacter sp.]